MHQISGKAYHSLHSNIECTLEQAKSTIPFWMWKLKLTWINLILGHGGNL